jgi:NifU-like protein
MQYSKKVHSRIAQPLHRGSFQPEEASARQMRLVIGCEGSISDGRAVRLFWLVDESDGIIADVRFEAFGPSALLAAADLACEMLIRKNYDQTRRITAELLDRQGRDRSDKPAFPEEAGTLLNFVLFAIEEAALQCMDIPLADVYVASPIDSSGMEGGGYPQWKELSTQQKIAVLEEVIASEIQPYIQLDAGGVQVVNLLEGREVIIAYEGSCTSCHSATGSTLHAIQEILRAKVSPDLLVTPDLSVLNKSVRP